MSHACDRCLRRPWLLRELSGHLDLLRANIAELLALGEVELIEAVAGRRRPQLHHQLAELDAWQARREAEQVGLELICQCDPAYPDRLRGLAGAPAALHVCGGVQRFLAAAASDPVAIVGSRRATSYGTSVARSLARGLAAAGVPVISGLALGIDSAAHQGALTGSAPQPTGSAPALTGPAPQLSGPASTVAVLPGPANQPYPRAARSLHRQLLTAGVVVSEMPPGAPVRSWMFLARNRIIAGLAAMTVVVEAATRSGALVTARHARELGRPVGAVPGPITSAQAAGPNRLIKEGAHLVAHAQDVLDLLFEAGTRTAPAHDRPALTSELRALLAAIEEGHDTAAALLGRGRLPEDDLAALASLELAGYIARAAGGRFHGCAMSNLEPVAGERIPRVLSIAGSDSGGGAGIQADLKAMAACGVHGMTAITAITAQNTVGVSAVHPVPPEVIEAQVRAVWEDIGIDAVKIGMLGDVPTIAAVTRALERLPCETPIVLDPVMVAESGAQLLEPSARSALVHQVLPRATVVTPNVPEARAMVAEKRGTDGAELGPEALARALHGLGAQAVVVTGGHRDEPTDVFFDGRRLEALAGERYGTAAAHGSGCTHSSALAARLAWGDDPLEAARFARELAGRAVRDGLEEIGAGAGPVDALGIRSTRRVDSALLT